MHRDLLGIYLNDHLAGATFGSGLAQRIAHEHRRSARGDDLQHIAEEIAQDRQTLLEFMGILDVPVRHYKICGGWAAERLRRMKPNGSLYRRSGLSTVIELETLRLGVEGKALMWHTLLEVSSSEARLDGSRLNGLLERARGQIDELESLRRTAAERLFSDERAV